MTLRILISRHLYDYSFVERAADAWWNGVASHLRQLGADSVKLSAIQPHEIPASSEIVVGHLCSYPLTHYYADRYRVAGLPVWDCEDFRNRSYRSRIIVRSADRLGDFFEYFGKRVTINSKGSLSGHIVLSLKISEYGEFQQTGQPAFRQTLISGSHLNSINLVRRGEADICACDGVTWRLLKRHCPEVCKGLETIGYGPWFPGIPYVVSSNCADEQRSIINQALKKAIDDPKLAIARQELGLLDVTEASDEDYAEVRDMDDSQFADYGSMSSEIGSFSEHAR